MQQGETQAFITFHFFDCLPTRVKKCQWWDQWRHAQYSQSHTSNSNKGWSGFWCFHSSVICGFQSLGSSAAFGERIRTFRNHSRNGKVNVRRSGFGSVVTKPPKVQRREKWGVKCSEVKWCEVDVMIFGEMCVLSLIYSYVAVGRFRAVRCVIVICFYFYFLITWPLFFNMLFMDYLFCISCILCFCILLCTVSSFAYSSFLLLYKFTDHGHRVETQLQTINIISYHIS
jgi:hypothetical protein